MRSASLLFLALTLAINAAETKPAPPLRTHAEVEAALSKTPPGPGSRNRQLTIVLVASTQDHGPGKHDYPAWQKNWLKLLSQSDAVTVTNAWKWPTSEQFQQADVLVFYYWNHAWTNAYQQIDS